MGSRDMRFSNLILGLFAGSHAIGRSSEAELMARLEFLENEIAAKEARIMELRRRRKPTMSPKADGDFVPTLPSCEDDSTPDLTQMWIDACQIAQNYQIINFQEAVNNQMSEDMSKSELVPLAVRQLKNKFSTLQVGVQTLSSKVTCGFGENSPKCLCSNGDCSFPDILLSGDSVTPKVSKMINSRNYQTSHTENNKETGLGNCLVKFNLRGEETILSLGGYPQTDAIEVFDQGTNEFHRLTSTLPAGGRSSFACGFYDGEIWICGGILIQGTSFDYLNSCYSVAVSSLNDFNWVERPSINTARGHISRNMEGPGNDLMIAGGMINGKPVRSVDLLIRYGPGAYEWVEYSEALSFAADQLAQAKVDGELFLFGGSDDAKAVYKFRESSNEFLKVGSLQTARIDAKAEVMNGDVYIIDGNRFERNMSIEIYNPASDSSKIVEFDSIDAGQGYDSILV